MAQSTLFEVSVKGKPIVQVFGASDNLGRAGVRVGPFYVDKVPDSGSLFFNVRWAKGYLGLGYLKMETSNHWIIIDVVHGKLLVR